MLERVLRKLRRATIVTRQRDQQGSGAKGVSSAPVAGNALSLETANQINWQGVFQKNPSGVICDIAFDGSVEQWSGGVPVNFTRKP